jgi:hypothetical protein
VKLSALQSVVKRGSVSGGLKLLTSSLDVVFFKKSEIETCEGMFNTFPRCEKTLTSE